MIPWTTGILRSMTVSKIVSDNIPVNLTSEKNILRHTVDLSCSEGSQMMFQIRGSIKKLKSLRSARKQSQLDNVGNAADCKEVSDAGKLNEVSATQE